MTADKQIDERAAFEEWARTEGGYTKDDLTIYEGEYMDSHANTALEAFTAGRVLATTAPAVEKEASVLDRCYAPSCGKWDGNDSCTCQRDASPAVGDSAGEPTLRQFRWMSPTGEASDWQDTGTHEIAHLNNYPPSRGGRYEFRELYAHPPAKTADAGAPAAYDMVYADGDRGLVYPKELAHIEKARIVTGYIAMPLFAGPTLTGRVYHIDEHGYVHWKAMK